jgi:uncharacterized protein
LDFVIDILKRADTGIDTIEIVESSNKETNKTEYIPIFKYAFGDKPEVLTFQEQSNGVQSLYLQLGLYTVALDLGLVLALDEFDINLHPELLPMLIELFENKNLNTKDAQIIFTTHNNEIMDKLGKYKVVLVNKEQNESYLYRLDEIGGDILRSDRPISPIYKANKIGGKPKVVYFE